MRLASATFLFAFASAAGASADPLPWPATDYEGQFTIQGPGGHAVTVSLRYQSATRRAAVSANVRGVDVRGLVDMDSRKMRLALSAMPDQIVEIGLPKKTMAMAGEGRPTEEVRVVDGETCRMWDLERAKVCFAEDGVWRLVESGRATITAVNVRRAPQSGEAFELADKKPQKLPALLKGAGLEGLNPFPF